MKTLAFQATIIIESDEPYSIAYAIDKLNDPNWEVSTTDDFITGTSPVIFISKKEEE